MSVLVVGASGAIGGAVVRGLLALGIEVRASSRTPEKLNLPDRVRLFSADLDDPASFISAVEGVERVFLYSDLHAPKPLMEVFLEAGVRHVVLLSSSSVTSADAAEDFNGSRFLRVEEAIKDSSLAYTFLRPGGFASNASRWNWGIKAQGAVSLPYPEAVQVPIHEQDIADVAVLALTSEELIGTTPILTGPERLTLRQQVETIGAVTGQDVAVIQQTEAESEEMLSHYVPEVWVHQILKDWRKAVGTTPLVSDEYERLIGRPSRSFRTWVEDNADLFTQ